MDKRLRPIPFPWPKEWWAEYRRCRDAYGWPHYVIVNHIRVMNMLWRNKPGKHEKCLARTRRNTLCQAPARINGRCKLHGGKTPKRPHKTPESRARSLANLKQYRVK